MGKSRGVRSRVAKAATGEKLFLHEDHGPKVSRRGFIQGGLISLAGFSMVPTVLGAFERKVLAANADPCAGAGGLAGVKYIAIECPGGPSFESNWLPLGSGGSTLGSYANLGFPNGMSKVKLTNEFGTPMVSDNGVEGPCGVLTGLLNPLPANGALGALARSNTKMATIWSPSEPDTGNSPHHALSLIASTGVRGDLISRGTSSGAPGAVIRADSNTHCGPALADTLLRPLSVNTLDDLLGALSFGPALEGLPKASREALIRGTMNLNASQSRRYAGLYLADKVKDLLTCGWKQNFKFTSSPADLSDPRKDANCKAVYGITEGSATTAAAVVEASIVFNLLNGTTGPANITCRDGDYHIGAQSRVEGRAYDIELGQRIGRILELAARMGVPVLIDVIEDGSMTCDQAGLWVADSSQGGGRVLIHFNPTKVPSFAHGTQLGFYDDILGSQSANNKTFLGTLDSKGPAYTVLYNWLALNKRESEFRNYVHPTLFPPPEYLGMSGDEVMRLFA